jgi:hypothetical protein
MLVRDPNEPHDKGAIRVMRSNGEQLGFIPAHVSRGGDSSGLAFQMDHGSQYRCTISDLTGAGAGRSLGVNIEVTEVGPDSVLPTETTPMHFNATPIPNNLRWLWFVAAAILLFVIALIVHNSS